MIIYSLKFRFDSELQRSKHNACVLATASRNAWHGAWCERPTNICHVNKQRRREWINSSLVILMSSNLGTPCTRRRHRSTRAACVGKETSRGSRKTCWLLATSQCRILFTLSVAGQLWGLKLQNLSIRPVVLKSPEELIKTQIKRDSLCSWFSGLGWALSIPRWYWYCWSRRSLGHRLYRARTLLFPFIVT